jgi:ribonuclease VapC
MAKAVLDASALLAFVNREPGGNEVALVLDEAVISSVNYSESLAKLVGRGASPDYVVDLLGAIEIAVVDFDQPQAEGTASLLSRTRPRGLSLGDRACLALAARERLPVMTCDRAWAELDLDVEVKLIR